MPGSIHQTPQTSSRRARRLASIALVGGVLVAGCGASARRLTTTTVPGATTSAATAAASGGAASSSSTTAGASASGPLAFARCMRANGVPNFPDPIPGRGFLFNAGTIDRAAPAVEAAQAKCHNLLPRGGPPGPGATTHPSAATLTKLLTIAHCMRAHGIPQFPDPRTSVPPNPFGSGTGVITDYDGAILLFPSTLNMQSPAYRQATAACGTLAEKLGSGPHSH